RLWSYVSISLVCMAVLVFLFRFFKDQEKKFIRGTMVSLSIVAVLYSSFYIALGKTQSLDPYEHLIPYALNGGKNVPLDDLGVVRSDFYDSLDNSGMFWGIPTIQAFHSIVPGSVMEFYKYIGVQRDVGSRPEVSHYGLRGLTSVRWLFDDDHDDEYFAGEETNKPQMPGWVYYGNANGFDIWENQYAIPMGFAYDSYITEEEVSTVPQLSRELLMLKTAIIPAADEAKWAAVLPKFQISTAKYTESAYFEDCLKKTDLSCNSFTYTEQGFDATTKAKKDQMIFFSVPYESGWKATVNGKPTEVLRTNIGFMTVRVPEGEEIRISFTYTTPGVFWGIIITLFSVGALVAYLLIMRTLGKKQVPQQKERPKRLCGNFCNYAKAMNATFKKRDPQGYLRRKTGSNTKGGIK
ncbi:MAG: YfhO family protein, partial [Oscillospiraceae bacterium]